MKAFAIAAILAVAACSGPLDTVGPESLPARGLSLDSGGIQPDGTPLRIDFGRYFPGTVRAVSALLGDEPADDQVTFCGAGLASLGWANGLTLYFRDGTFVGWASAEGRGQPVRLATGTAPGDATAAVPPGITAEVGEGRIRRLSAGQVCTAA